MNARFVAVLVAIAAVHVFLGAVLFGVHKPRPVDGPPADRQGYEVVEQDPGQPAEADDAANAATPREHVVQRGESYWLISRQYKVSIEALRQANGHAADHVLQAGERLRIPTTSNG